MGKILTNFIMSLGEEKGKEMYEEFKAKQNEYNRTPTGRAVYLANRYRESDRHYGRTNAINGQWIKDNIFNNQCIYCGETDWTKLGCDRIDNSVGHIPENVVCCCGKCNKEKHRKSFATFYREKIKNKKDIA